MEKSKNSDIKPYSFATIGEDRVLKGSSFTAFEFGKLESSEHLPDQQTIRSEREAAAKSDFKFDDIVREYRGLSNQEQDDLEKRISTEVTKRLQKIQETAYRDGLEKGRLEGSDAAFKESLALYQQQVESMVEVVGHFQRQTAERFERNKGEIYETIKRLVKWLTLKECSQASYLPRLLEKLILEMGIRQNLIIKVSADVFSSMPQALEEVQAKLGALPNVRVEISHEVQGAGLVLESENGVLDGTPDALFLALDKMFETVVGHES